MILRLIGHDYKYAVEQIMLAVFPAERPDYQWRPTDDLSAESRLSMGAVYAQAVTIVRKGNSVFLGVSRVKQTRLTGELETNRLLQKIVKQSFYRAAVRLSEYPPPWGSLTGIRPAKLACAVLEAGGTKKMAANTLMREYYVSPPRAELCADAASAGLTIKQSVRPGDIALYLGIPFCPTRCAYCSFVSNSVEKSFELIEPFVNTLLSEIDAAAHTVKTLGLRIITVYLGGGTPTTLSASQLETVMQRLKSAFDLTHVREYTVEAGRPDTITAEKLEVIKKFGAARISVNPQSMSSAVLSAIGRNHSPDDVLKAIELVRKYGISVLNTDVIAGLPNDTIQGFCESFNTILIQAPENITIHTLSLKKGSRIMLEDTALPDANAVSAMLDYASGRLRELGYKPYYLYRQKFTSGGFENTGWCLPGYEGLYNVCMMEELCTVVSLGGGGVTKLVSPNGRIERIFNAKYPREYILRAENIEHKMGRIAAFYAVEEENGV